MPVSISGCMYRLLRRESWLWGGGVKGSVHWGQGGGGGTNHKLVVNWVLSKLLPHSCWSPQYGKRISRRNKDAADKNEKKIFQDSGPQQAQDRP